jgi:hypothetical protein
VIHAALVLAALREAGSSRCASRHYRREVVRRGDEKRYIEAAARRALLGAFAAKAAFS